MKIFTHFTDRLINQAKYDLYFIGMVRKLVWDIFWSHDVWLWSGTPEKKKALNSTFMGVNNNNKKHHLPKDTLSTTKLSS